MSEQVNENLRGVVVLIEIPSFFLQVENFSILFTLFVAILI
jgi:hypothetical protein